MFVIVFAKLGKFEQRNDVAHATLQSSEPQYNIILDSVNTEYEFTVVRDDTTTQKGYFCSCSKIDYLMP